MAPGAEWVNKSWEKTEMMMLQYWQLKREHFTRGKLFELDGNCCYRGS